MHPSPRPPAVVVPSRLETFCVEDVAIMVTWDWLCHSKRMYFNGRCISGELETRFAASESEVQGSLWVHFYISPHQVETKSVILMTPLTSLTPVFRFIKDALSAVGGERVWGQKLQWRLDYQTSNGMYPNSKIYNRLPGVMSPESKPTEPVTPETFLKGTRKGGPTSSSEWSGVL